MEIKHQLAVVTGGVSGLGKATAKYLAEKGAKIAVLDSQESQCHQVAKEIDGLGIPCDVSQESQVVNAFEQAINYFNAQAHITVNCAGICPAKRVVGKQGPCALDWFDQVIQVNLIGTFNVMKMACASMMKNTANPEGEKGVVINTSSVAAFEGQMGQAAYSASKGGVAAMTLPVAREMAQHGIRIMTIAPGLMETPMMAGFSQEVKDNLHAQTVFPKRLGKPEEFAQLVAQIVENPLLNGEVIRLDGALRMQA